MRNEETQYPKPTQHPDYARNLNWGAKFTKNYNDVFDQRFFAIRVSKNLDGEKWYFIFSFFVPLQYGKELYYGNPVDPNQDSETFNIIFKNTYSGYFNLQRRFDEKRMVAAEFSAFDAKR